MAQNICTDTGNKQLRHNIANKSITSPIRCHDISRPTSYKVENVDIDCLEDPHQVDETIVTEDPDWNNDDNIAAEDDMYWDSSVMDVLQVEYNELCSSPTSHSKSINFKRKIYPIESKCAVCNKIFSCQRDFAKHAQEDHPTAKSFKCQYCPALFSKFKSVTAHFNRTHTDPDNRRSRFVSDNLRSHDDSYKRKSHTDSDHIRFFEPDNGRSYIDSDKSDLRNYENNLEEDDILSHKKGKYYAVDDKCAVCEKQFSFQRDLIRHTKEDHPNEKVFKCLYCTTLFSKLKSVNTHYKRSHSKLMKNYSCEYCDMTFFTHFLLERHRRAHTEQRPFVCKECSKTYKYKRNLLVHMKTHSKNCNSSDIKSEEQHMDNEEQNIFPEDEYRKHEQQQNIVTGNECRDIIEQNFESQNDEVIDISEDASDEEISNKIKQYEFKCNECPKAYKYNKDLKFHKKKHHKKEITETITIDDDTTTNDQYPNFYNSTYFIIDELNTDVEHSEDLGDETYATVNYSDDYTYEDFGPIATQHSSDVTQNECGICMKVFKCQQAVAKHLQRCHVEVEFFKCPYCDDNFYSLDTLSQHINISKHPQKRNVCEMCLKSFDRRSDLRRHIRIHTDERPYACNICYKTFKQTNHLKRHKDINHDDSSNVQNFKCHLCQKSFLLEETLKRHISAHAREANYACQMCDKTFKTRYDWQRHQETHSSRKYLTCEFCLKSFDSLQNLNLHLNTHTGDRKFLCTICGKAYKEKSHLVNHRKVHN